MSPPMGDDQLIGAGRITGALMTWLCAVVVLASITEAVVRDESIAWITLPFRVALLVGLLIAVRVSWLSPVTVGRLFLAQALLTMLLWAIVGQAAPAQVTTEAIGFGTILSVFALMVAPRAHRRWWMIGVIVAAVVLSAIRILPENADTLVQIVTVLAIHGIALAGLESHASTAERASEMGSIDVLTGLWNRRPTLRHLEQQVEHHARGRATSSMVLMDLDRFKEINDSQGHLAGDRVLQRVASAVTEIVRPVDLVSRWGGEEFLVVLPGLDVTAALDVAERLRRAVSATGVTASFGVEEICAGESVDGWIGRTDQSMYHSKRAGRDRVSSLGSTIARIAPSRTIEHVSTGAPAPDAGRARTS